MSLFDNIRNAAVAAGRTAPPPAIGPSGEAGLLAKIGGGALGAVASVGNVLDLPGSSIRDILVGENPFDQWLTPTSHENRTTGRQMLDNWGVTPKNRENAWDDWGDHPEEFAYDVLGLGVEYLLDPFGPLLKGATTPIMKGMSKRARAALGVAQQKSRLINGVVGKTEKTYDYLKRIGSALFEPAVGGTIDPVAQAFMRGYTKAEGAREALNQQLATAVSGNFEKLGLPMRGEAGEEVARQIRLHVENVDRGLLPKAAADQLDILENFKENMRGLLESAGVRSWEHSDEAGIDHWFRRQGDEAKALYQDTVGRLEKSTNEAMSQGFGTKTKAGFSRNPVLEGNYKGSEGYNKLFKDPVWQSLIEDVRVDPRFKDGIPVVPLVGRKHLDNIADTLGVTTHELWDRMGAVGRNGVADPVQVETFLNGVVSLSSSLNPNTHAQVFGRHMFDDLESQAGRAFSGFDPVTGTATGAKRRIQRLSPNELDQTLTGRILSPTLKKNMTAAKDAGQSVYRITDNLNKESYVVERTVNKAAETLKKQIPHIRARAAKELVTEREATLDVFRDTITKNYGSDIIDDMHKYVSTGKNAGTWEYLDQAGNPKHLRQKDVARVLSGELTPVTVSRYDELTKMLADNPELRQAGMFENNPLVDWLDGMNSAVHRLSMAESLQDFILKTGIDPVAVPLNVAEKTKGIPVSELLENYAQDFLTPQFVDNIAANKFKTATKGRLDNVTDAMRVRVRGMHIDGNVSNELLGAFRVLRHTDEMAAFGKSLKTFTSLFKMGVLTHPARYFRDGVSALMQNVLMGGVTPGLGGMRSYSNATKLARGKTIQGLEYFDEVKDFARRMGKDPDSAEDLTQAFLHMYAGKKGDAYLHHSMDSVTPEALAQSGKLDSILETIPGQRTIKEGFAAQMESQPWYQQINPVNAPGTYGFDGKLNVNSNLGVYIGNGVGRYIDDVNRLAPILDRMRRGAKFDEAFDFANRIQVDYSSKNFTRFEQRFLKQVFPFYSFVSRTVPVVASELMANPTGPMAMMLRTQRLQNQGFTPHQLQDTTAIPLGTDAEGNKRYLTSLGLMHEEGVEYLGGVMRGELGGVVRKILGSSNPLIKGPVEYATNTSTFFDGPSGGRRINELDPTIGRLLTNIGLREEPESGRAQPFISQDVEFVSTNAPWSRFVRNATQLTDQRKSLVERMTNVLTGFRTSSFDERAMRYELQERINTMAVESGLRTFTNVAGADTTAARYREQGNEKAAQQVELLQRIVSQLRQNEERN